MVIKRFPIVQGKSIHFFNCDTGIVRDESKNICSKSDLIARFIRVARSIYSILCENLNDIFNISQLLSGIASTFDTYC